MTPDPAAVALVHEGWDHLRRQRPLAAWASWRRALRAEPDQPAASQALERLAAAEELPASARREYRFRTPDDEARRARWDAAFHGRDLSELADAGETFAALADADLKDSDAPYNRALCLAWLGRNAEAVAWLDRAGGLLVEADFEAAVGGWRLAEILRQGAGAESLAQDFSHAIDLSRLGDPATIRDAIAGHAVFRRMPTPVNPGVVAGLDEVTVDEWLDRPMPDPSETPPGLAEVPRVLAIVLGSGRGLRLSLPSVEGLAEVRDVLDRLGIGPVTPIMTPLPLPLLDASAWTIRLPGWVDDEARRRIYREAVEDYHENRWIKRPRPGLDGLTPIEAAGRATAGDRRLLAKLEAAITLREELADRPSSSELYQGYPFDRLRARLGLSPKDAGAIEPLDPGSMSGPDLDRLDPDTLDAHALADAFSSSAALGDDARTSRFAARLVDLRSQALARLDLRAAFAPMVRHALDEDRPGVALRRIDEAIEIDGSLQGGRRLAEFTTWKAELLARIGESDRAVEIYRKLAEGSDTPSAVALDGAETLLDNGELAQARTLAELAMEFALNRGDGPAALEAGHFLEGLEP